MPTKYLISLILLVFAAPSSQAQEFYQFKNRWKPEEYIHIQEPKPASTPIQNGWWSAQWILESVDGSYYKIKNRWKPEYLHIQNGAMSSSSIEPGWWSAQWNFEPIEGTSFFRIRNRWKPEIAIHNQNGYLEAGFVQLGWWSGHWEMIKVTSGSTQPVVEQPAKQVTAVAAQNRRGDNPRAFSPEHNGTIATAFVRYTDQISISTAENQRSLYAISKGDRIYFFSQEAVGDIKGISFDPKNPAICGQTFTVIETSPSLKLDRPMPMMRNENNYSFVFVVEVY